MKNTLKSHGKLVKSAFKAPSWARNRHIQTIWPRFIQTRMPLSYTWERITLPDGDFVDLAWGPKPVKLTGMVVMFHGLEGSIRSHYANDMMAYLSRHGWQVVLMHFRGCSGDVNLTPRAYHSGETGDPIFILELLEQRFASLPKVAIGFSLGGNMLMKLLGENPAQQWLQAAVSVSAPLKLDECARSINQGFSKVYQTYLLKSMKKTLLKKMQLMDYRKSIQLSEADVAGISDFWAFDDRVTAPLHGYHDAADYYEKCSGFYYLKAIHQPTLLLHSMDDPFMNQHVIPDETELARHVTMEISERGGHVGFMQGTITSPTVWLHERVHQFFADYLPMAEDS